MSSSLFQFFFPFFFAFTSFEPTFVIQKVLYTFRSCHKAETILLQQMTYLSPSLIFLILIPTVWGSVLSSIKHEQPSIVPVLVKQMQVKIDF